MSEKSSTFAANFSIMRKRLIFLSLVLATFCFAEGSVITLRNGQQIKGEVVIQNDEVVIVRNAEGARFQYPASEVVSVTDTESVSNEHQEKESGKSKSHGQKVTLLVDLTGGVAIIPQDKAGGHIGGEFMIGSRRIGEKSIFIGGGIGVNGLFLGGKSYTFLPLQVAVNVPFIEGKHSPFAGAAVGYGFGLNKSTGGGIYTAAQVGYRYSISARSALLVSLRVQFQQAEIEATEVITGDDGVETAYVGKAGRSFVTFGASIGITF